MSRYTKEQLNEIIDSGEPILVIRASQPRSFAIASTIKSIYLTAQLFDEAAYARETEKEFQDWHTRTRKMDPPPVSGSVSKGDYVRCLRLKLYTRRALTVGKEYQVLQVSEHEGKPLIWLVNDQRVTKVYMFNPAYFAVSVTGEQLTPPPAGNSVE